MSNDRIISDLDGLESFAQDETGVFRNSPDLILFPTTTEEVSLILKYCNDNGITVTPRAAGTSLAGNATTFNGGVVVSLVRMNRILRLDANNKFVVAESGCIAEELQNYVAEYGLCYPVDPASSGTSLIGGHVMTNASGPRAFKYGATKNFVKALTAVLPNGEIIRTGTLTEKNSTGYNLTQLLTGSEGTLAIVTEITLNLIKKPAFNNTVLISFEHLEDGLGAILKLKSSSLDISAIEFIERDALDFVADYEGFHSIHLEENCVAHLLIEIEAFSLMKIEDQLIGLSELMEDVKHLNMIVADNSEEKQKLWHVRKLIGHAVRHHSVYREVDTVVPVDKLTLIIEIVKSIGQKYNFRSVCYGHAGNGNLHVNILKENMEEDQWLNVLSGAVREIFTEVIKMGGALSGEHGIGLLNRQFMDLQFTPFELQLMKNIKLAFDPNGILNPGKIFPV